MTLTALRSLGGEREESPTREERTPVYNRHGTEVVWINGLDQLLACTNYAGLAETFCSTIDVGHINASRSAIKTLARQGQTRCEICDSRADVVTAMTSDACEEPRTLVGCACDRDIRPLTDGFNAPFLRACLQVETHELSWQSVAWRRTRDLLDVACTRLAKQGGSHVQAERRKSLEVTHAGEWCNRVLGHVPHCSLAIEMSGLFAALCVHSSNSPVAGLTTFFWAALAGICEYYVGADVSRDEVEWLVEKAISAAKECVLRHNAEGAAVAAAVIECTVVQLIDNMTRIMQHPELYDLDDYVRLKGVDVGVHVYTPRDDLSAKFENLNDEATIVAILAHDLIDYERDVRNNNNNNLCLKLGDMDQLWDILEVCLSHTCAVAGEQWQQVVAGFVVGTCLYARGGRERKRGRPSVTITAQLRPSVEWRHAGKMQEYFESGVCQCRPVVCCIDLHDAMGKIYENSAYVIRSWLNNEQFERIEIEALQRLALACISEIRKGDLFVGKHDAQYIF